MRTYLDCFPCFLDQALRAGRAATGDEQKIKRLLDEVGMMIRDIQPDSTPPETGRRIYQKVREITGKSDPYREIKEENTAKALALYPSLRRTVHAAADRLHGQNYELFKAHVIKHPKSIDIVLNFLTISRYLERIADLATNIAEDVIYLNEGTIVRHTLT